MVIVCPSCATEYTLEAHRIGPQGRSVRCAHCRNSWFVGPADGLAEAADSAAARAEPEADAAVVIDEAGIDAGRPSLRRTVRTPQPASAKRPAGGLDHRRDRLALAAAALTVAVALAAVALRVPIVRAAPASASLFAVVGLPVNVLGVTIGSVVSGYAEEAGRRVLVTDGTIANATRHEVRLPDIEITIEGRSGETLYRWSTKAPVPELAAGGETPFSVRLASPPPDGERVLVAFRTRAGASVASR